MAYVPTQRDYDLLFNQVTKIGIKIEICNKNGTLVTSLTGIKPSLNYSIDGTSTSRRQINGTIIPTKIQGININQDGLVWLDKDIIVSIGFYDYANNKWVYYPCGKYIFTSANSTENSSTYELSFSAIDFWSKLDGTEFGVLGNFVNGTIKAYERDVYENKIDGTELSIKNALLQVLSMTNIDDYIVENIGEYAGTEKADNYIGYRLTNPNWDKLPYDIEFGNKDTVADIIKRIIELYPNNDASFDNEGILKIGLLPSNDNENVILTNEQIKRILIGSSGKQASYDLTSIKNIVYCVGNSFDSDFYTELVTSNGTNYILNIDRYGTKNTNNDIKDYYDSDIITFVANETNKVNATLQIEYGETILDSIPIYNGLTGRPLEANKFKIGQAYTVKIKKLLVNGIVTRRAILLGSYQPNGMVVCTDDVNINPFTDKNGVEYDSFDKLRKYFQTTYNIQNVKFMILKDSPFTIQKLGERVFAYETDKSKVVDSDASALGCAEYCLWQKVRLTESVTITTKLIPWLSDNNIIEFALDGENVYKYIVKQINNTIDSGQCTSTITMYKYYTLYNENNIEFA